MKMKFIRNIAAGLLLISVFPLSVEAQDTLRVEEAIRLALEKNFAIRIARNDARIAGNNNSMGNAGMLPVLSSDGSINRRVEDNVTEFSSDNIPDRNDIGVETTVYNYGIDANWTVFDGLTMFATLDRLSLEADIGDIEAQLQVEMLLADLISGYYQVVGQQQAYQILENTLDISRERIRIAETKNDLGSGSEYDLLQARADLNADRAALIRSGTSLKQVKILINEILSDSSFSDFEVQANIEMGERLELNSLISDANRQNRELSITRMNESVAKTEVREITGEWFPQIDLSGGYGYSRVESSAGFTDFSETTGFNYGITARLSLFDGLNRSRRKQNAQIRLKNEQLRTEELQLQITSQVKQTHAQYTDALELIELEKENLQYTNQSLDIALERYRLGTINSVELREAQLSLLNAENRLIVAQIEAKRAETELLRLSGRLLNRTE